mmetsp:Transcript_20934/g.23993  ORF Transcript_20934/g.23993 Transcript_20934/m.23993 type:complete len:82 (-) Transcript_20934:717-962(-)
MTQTLTNENYNDNNNKNDNDNDNDNDDNEDAFHSYFLQYRMVRIHSIFSCRSFITTRKSCIRTTRAQHKFKFYFFPYLSSI